MDSGLWIIWPDNGPAIGTFSEAWEAQNYAEDNGFVDGTYIVTELQMP